MFRKQLDLLSDYLMLKHELKQKNLNKFNINLHSYVHRIYCPFFTISINDGKGTELIYLKV